MALALREFRGEIVTAGTLAAAARILDADDPLDLVVVDQGFARDGLQAFLERVGDERPGVAVVLTGQEFRAASHLHDLYVRKPFDVEWMVESVARLLLR